MIRKQAIDVQKSGAKVGTKTARDRNPELSDPLSLLHEKAVNRPSADQAYLLYSSIDVELRRMTVRSARIQRVNHTRFLPGNRSSGVSRRRLRAR
jgi:hypothetical protein